MGDVDPILRRYRVDIHSLTVGFPEPASIFKLQKEFEGNFGEDVPFRRFGYMSFEVFLNDHPDLERVFVDGKPCYRAKVSERTADILSLVARQRKTKKKRGGNKRGRGTFQRNVQTRNFHVRPNTTAYSAPPFNNNFQHGSFRGRGGGYAQPQNFSRTSFTAPPRSSTGFGTANSSFARPQPVLHPPPHVSSFARPQPVPHPPPPVSSFARPQPVPHPPPPVSSFARPQPVPHPPPPISSFAGSQPVPPTAPIVQQPAHPTTGKARILAALKECGGTATLTKLNYAYQGVYKTQMDGNEMKKYFGTANFKAIHAEYLADDMDFKANETGQWTFISKEIAKRQQEWTANHQNIVVSETPRPRWDKPTLKELYDKVVAMLVNMYPATIKVADMAEIYKRAHEVIVDPETLYCKSWIELVKYTFSDKLTLRADGSVALTEKAEREHGLRKSAPVTAVTNAIKRVTADDLGLEYSDDSSYEDWSSEDGTNSSLTSTSTMSRRVPHNGASMPVNNHVQEVASNLEKLRLKANSGFGAASNNTLNSSIESTQLKAGFGSFSALGEGRGFGAVTSNGFGGRTTTSNSQSMMGARGFGSGGFSRLQMPYGLCPTPSASNAANQNK